MNAAPVRRDPSLSMLRPTRSVARRPSPAMDVLSEPAGFVHPNLGRRNADVSGL